MKKIDKEKYNQYDQVYVNADNIYKINEAINNLILNFGTIGDLEDRIDIIQAEINMLTERMNSVESTVESLDNVVSLLERATAPLALNGNMLFTDVDSDIPNYGKLGSFTLNLSNGDMYILQAYKKGSDYVKIKKNNKIVK